jgi:conjugative transposon TraM protein
MENTHSQAFKKKRQMMVFLPVVVIPFLAIFFSLFGGGSNAARAGQNNPNGSGLNATVPTASEDNVIYSSKLKAYEKVGEDSITRLKRSHTSLLDRGIEALLASDISNVNYAGSEMTSATALNYDLNLTKEEQLDSPQHTLFLKGQKSIEETKMLMGGNSDSPSQHKQYASPYPAGTTYKHASPSAGYNGFEKDYHESIKQRNELLSLVKKKFEEDGNSSASSEQPVAMEPSARVKPARVKKNTLKVNAEKQHPSVVSRLKVKSRESVNDALKEAGSAPANGFYSPGQHERVSDEQNIIMAVIHNDQSVMAGATVKMRLVNAIQIGNTRIPKGSFLHGICSISNERMNIKVNSIKYKELLYPLDLVVFDMDGIQGLYIPGSIERTAAKSGASQGIGGTNIIGFNPSVEAQLAQTAIEAGKTIVSRRASAVRIKVKANYQILLKPSEEDEE